MTDSSHTRGTRGEQEAAHFLRNHGYTILQKNYRDKVSRCEIDLIAQDQECVVFVEVKTAAGKSFGPPETWVNSRKQKRLALAANQYIHDNNLYNTDCRLDVIGVKMENGRCLIHHLKHAFPGSR